MREHSSSLLSLVLALALAAPALADVVVTTSGGRITGKVIHEDDACVKVKTDKGVVVTIRRDEVESVSKERPEDVFARKLAKIAADDAKGFLKLAEWCESERLPAQARECWERAIKADPDEETARAALGYRRVGGKWLRGDERKRAEGLVQHDGKWVTPQEKEALEQGLVKKGDRWITKEEAEAEAEPDDSVIHVAPSAPKKSAETKPAETKPAEPKPEPRPAPEPRHPAPPSKPEAPPATPKPETSTIPLGAEEKELVSIIRTSTKDERRLEAVRALAARGDTGKAALKVELEALLAKAKKDLVAAVKIERNQIRAKLVPVVVERRAAALGFINDKTRYPEENHGAAGQKEVDRLVDHLRRVVQDPLREVAEVKGAFAKIAKLLDEARKLAEWSREHAESGADPKKVEDELALEAAKVVKMQHVPVDEKDAQALAKSLDVVKYNETVKSSMTAEERECVRLTNEYRMLFGLHALKAFEPLVQAARKHSEEMSRLNYFAHESPVAANANPAARCAREGGKFAGENIAMGMVTGAHAFDAWYTSSGHHRNMLFPKHKSIGLGQHKNYWTEDFGFDDPS